MKRAQFLKNLRKAAKAAGKDFEEYELTNHTGITIGQTKTTLGRHNEIDEITVKKILKHFASELGSDQ